MTHDSLELDLLITCPMTEVSVSACYKSVCHKDAATFS